MNSASLFYLFSESVVVLLLILFDQEVTAPHVYKAVEADDGTIIDLSPLLFAQKKFVQCYNTGKTFQHNSLSQLSTEKKTELCRRVWNIMTYGEESEFDEQYLGVKPRYERDLPVSVEGTNYKVNVFGSEITFNVTGETTYMCIIGACDPNALYVASCPDDLHRGPGDKTVPDSVILFAYVDGMDFDAAPPTGYAQDYVENSVSASWQTRSVQDQPGSSASASQRIPARFSKRD